MPTRISYRLSEMKLVYSQDGSRLRASAAVFVLMIALLASTKASAAVVAYRPSNSSSVVLTLANNDVESALARLRAASENSPNDAERLVEYIRKLMSAGAATGNERYYGFAEAALERAPQSIAQQLQLLRAQLLQHRHAFKESESVLTRLIELEPRNADALLMRAQVRMHLHDPAAAMRDCAKLQLTTDLLTSATCSAQARTALNGDQAEAQRAYSLLTLLLKSEGGPNSTRSWSAGVAAELAARLGHTDDATTWFRTAYELDGGNHFARLSYADWLLELGKRADAAAVASTGTSSADKLRLVLANGRRDSADALQLQLSWREAAERGERTHLRDQARFELTVLQDPVRAHATALDNFQDQREIEDALLLASTSFSRHDRRTLELVKAWKHERNHFDLRLDRYLANAK